jgi:hypothetical protein
LQAQQQKLLVGLHSGLQCCCYETDLWCGCCSALLLLLLLCVWGLRNDRCWCCSAAVCCVMGWQIGDGCLAAAELAVLGDTHSPAAAAAAAGGVPCSLVTAAAGVMGFQT